MQTSLRLQGGTLCHLPSKGKVSGLSESPQVQTEVRRGMLQLCLHLLPVRHLLPASVSRITRQYCLWEIWQEDWGLEGFSDSTLSWTYLPRVWKVQSSQSWSDNTVNLGLPKGIWFCQRSLTHFIYTCQNEAGRLTFSFRVPAWITRLELSARNAVTADCKHFIDLLSSLVRVTYVQCSKSILLSEALKPSKASCLCHLVVSFHLPVN